MEASAPAGQTSPGIESLHEREDMRETSTTPVRDAASGGRPRVVLPSDHEVEMISEAKFDALVRGFEVMETEEGMVYRRDGHPWEYVRDGQKVIARYRREFCPERHFLIV